MLETCRTQSADMAMSHYSQSLLAAQPSLCKLFHPILFQIAISTGLTGYFETPHAKFYSSFICAN